jgi:hypothetical protein
MVHEIEIPGNNIKEIAIEATMPEAFYENNFKKMQ